MRTLRRPAVSRRASAKMRGIGTGPPEIVVEYLADHRPGGLGMGQEVVQLRACCGSYVLHRPPGPAEGRDAAFHGDAGTGEGSEGARQADEAGGFMNA